MTIDPKLIEHATPRQAEIATAINELGSAKEAAEHLGLSHSGVRRAMSELRKRAADPAPGGLPGGGRYKFSGMSVRVKDGEISGQNFRYKAEPDPAYYAEKFAESFATAIDRVKALPRVKAPKKVKGVARKSMNVIAIGDSHHGMLAWAPETLQSDYDLNISIETERRIFLDLLDRAPAARKLLIVRVGDVFHADGDVWKTKRSGHHLDGDGRMPRVINDVEDLSIWQVETALTRYEEVEVLIVPGNHDDLLAVTLAIALQKVFRKNNRVKIGPTSGTRFGYTRWGDVLLGVTHSDTTRGMGNLGEVMNNHREDASSATYRHWYCGHLHHRKQYNVDIQVKKNITFQEYRGWSAEIVNTVAPGDAYSAGCGFDSRRTMKLDTYNQRTLTGTIWSRVFDR